MRASLSSIPSRHRLGLLCCLLLATFTTGHGAWLPQRPRSTVIFNGGDVARGELSHDGLDRCWPGLRRYVVSLFLRSGDVWLHDLLYSLKEVSGDTLKSAVTVVDQQCFWSASSACQYGCLGLVVFSWVRSEAFGPCFVTQLEWVIPLGWAIWAGVFSPSIPT